MAYIFTSALQRRQFVMDNDWLWGASILRFRRRGRWYTVEI